ncbi:MAG: hypothetical protein ACWGOX_12365 [Desulforhopalus sp.]
MVVATQFIFSLVIAFSLSVIFSLFLRMKDPRSGFFFFFLMLFLVTLAGGLWIKPFGPTIYGVYWVPLMLIGVLAGLFLYQSAPRRLPRSKKEKIRRMREEQERRQLEELTYITIDFFFWLIILFLTVSIIYRLFLGD